MSRTVLSGVLTVVLTLIGGCGGASKMSIPISGPQLSREFATVVNVENWRGSVKVAADPNAQAPSVRARVVRVGKDGPKGKDLERSVSVSAAASFEGGRPTLRVVSRAAASPELDVVTELMVVVPRIQGTMVRNAGGAVEVVGGSGEVSIENGTSGRQGGPVVVRTGAAMTEPVNVHTTSGQVIYQVGPGSTGRFDLASDRGRADFTSNIGVVTGLRPEDSRCRAVLNEGVNPVTLHSSAGNVSARVLDNAATYGPEVWSGDLEWPTWPGWLAKLGGR